MIRVVSSGQQQNGSLSRSNELEFDLHWCLVRAIRGLGVVEHEALKQSGLSIRQYLVLLALHGGQSESQLLLARETKLDKSTLVRALDELEDEKLVKRSVDSQDRRVRGVAITAKGRQALARGRRQVARAEEAYLETLPAELREPFRRAATALGTGPDAATFDFRPAVR